MRTLSSLVVVLIVAGALGLGYLGLLPEAASVFGSNKPRDLGVKATASDLQSANSWSDVTLAEPLSSSNPVGSTNSWLSTGAAWSAGSAPESTRG